MPPVLNAEPGNLYPKVKAKTLDGRCCAEVSGKPLDPDCGLWGLSPSPRTTALCAGLCDYVVCVKSLLPEEILLSPSADGQSEALRESGPCPRSPS